MFEALETGKNLTAEEFKDYREDLRPALLEAQFALAKRDYPVLIVMGGFDGAGKGAVVHRLNEWMDARLIETHALWMHSDEEESRPYYWRFWQRLPPRGRIGIMLGTWYQRATYRAMAGLLDDAGFELAMRRAVDSLSTKHDQWKGGKFYICSPCYQGCHVVSADPPMSDAMATFGTLDGDL